MAYLPERGDVVWIQLDPQVGREQAGHRPALVLSPREFNRKMKVAFCCPITSRQRWVDLEVALPDHLEVSGVILAHQIKALDWRQRNARYMTRVPNDIIEDVLDILISIVD